MGRPVRSSTTTRSATSRPKTPCAGPPRTPGFGDVAFQYEPIAAAFDYERRVTSE